MFPQLDQDDVKLFNDLYAFVFKELPERSDTSTLPIESNHDFQLQRIYHGSRRSRTTKSNYPRLAHIYQ
jgi:hypothetical protein